MRIALLFIISSLFLLICCEDDNKEINDNCINYDFSDTVFIGYEPINIHKINSQFDDYNVYIGHSLGLSHLIVFSTNRTTNGGNFDLVSYNLILTSDYTRPDTTTFKYYVQNDTLFNKILPEINSDNNELGPYLHLIDFTPYEYKPGNDSILFFITKDIDGNQDIFYKKYSHRTYLSDYIPLENNFQNPSFINSDFDDAYVSINFDFNTLYFCSNRSDDFDIYQMCSKNNANIYNVLYNDSSYQIEKVIELCSDKADKCPFVNWNMIFFASNRDGGYGGYDLYYSVLEDSNWCEPINFGDKINTQFDEFRPVSIDNSIMIFSSNRPCGKGGYDLYIVRITDMK